MPYYLDHVRAGLDAVSSFGDGYSINVRWYQAYPNIKTNKIAYHIYYSTVKENVFTEGVKYVITDGYAREANIIDLTPGQEYFFSVRPVEYDPTLFDLNSTLTLAYDSVYVYPQSLLRTNISESDLTIPLIDVEGFPNNGYIKIGVELIRYFAVDSVNNNLILTSDSHRGVNNTISRIHTTDGYDGYFNWNPEVTLFTVGESAIFDRIFVCQSRFEYPNNAFTIVDGYHQITKDLLSTDLSASDTFNEDFPSYDYAGYHRTDPVQLLNGVCVGSYIGGEMYCIDGYGTGQTLRGFSLQEQNNQRQEMLLSITGRPATLIKRVRTGVTCSCYLPSREYPDDRCPLCLGTKFVVGYEQFFNPRRSDGKILVRPGPSDENMKIYEAGLESELPLELWTLTIPTIKNRDIIVLYDQDGNEEFRYEVITVNRNNTIVGLEGLQKMRVQRIRKFDPAYQIRLFDDSSMFPSKLNTSIGFTTGIPPHVHSITISEKITSVSQINQMTAVSQGHNHVIIGGVVQSALGHNHILVLP